MRCLGGGGGASLVVRTLCTIVPCPGVHGTIGTWAGFLIFPRLLFIQFIIFFLRYEIQIIHTTVRTVDICRTFINCKELELNYSEPKTNMGRVYLKSY